MRRWFAIVFFCLHLAAFGQIDQYLSNYNVSEAKGNVLITWTTSAGFTCEDIQIFFGTDSNQLTSVYTYPGICGSENKEEHYTYLFRDVAYNQPNYFQIDLGSFGKSDILAITVIAVGGLNPIIYPNPATPESTLLFNNDDQEQASIRVFNASGAEVGQHIVTRKNQVRLSKFLLKSPGLYFYTIEIKGVLLRGKFLFL